MPIFPKTTDPAEVALKLAKASNLSDVADQQTALNNVTNVAGATNEHVLTKDTGTGDVVFKAAAGVGKTSGWIPADSLRYTWSNGCSAAMSRETTAGRPDMRVVKFDGAAKQNAQAQVKFPPEWNKGTLSYKVHWVSTASDTDGVVFGLQAVAVGDGDTVDVDFGTAVEVTDAAQSADKKKYISAESGAITIADTPTDAKSVYFNFYRDPTNGSDTMAEKAEVEGIELFYTNT